MDTVVETTQPRGAILPSVLIVDDEPALVELFRDVVGRQALKVKLVDTIGGEAEIRAYLTSRGIDSALPMVDWDKKSNTPFLLAGAVSRLITIFGYDDLVKGQDLNGILPPKLLLDGLLSVWQVGRD